MRLIEKVWFQQHSAKYWLVPLLLPLTLLFWLFSSLRRIAYKCRILPSYKVSKPVIVVGNIGIGGNGKTPVVLWLITLCRQLGLQPGVISRGYGSKAPHYPYLLSPSSTVEESGDEPLMIYRRTQVPLCIGADRIQCAETLIKQGCNILIADDGLQHYRLQRDIEFIVVDGKRRFGNQLLLPAGPLREGLWRLDTVDYIINNGNQKPLPKEIPMSLIPSELINCATGQSISVNELLNISSKVNAIAGIGSPIRFFTTLRTLGFKLAKKQGFIDHHAFNQCDFDEFSEELPLLMTEKDAIKCHGFAQEHWWYVPVNAHFPKLEERLLIQRIESITV